MLSINKPPVFNVGDDSKPLCPHGRTNFSPVPELMWTVVSALPFEDGPGGFTLDRPNYPYSHHSRSHSVSHMK